VANLVTIKNVSAQNLRIGTQTIASLASATVDCNDEKTARDLDSFAGRYAVFDSAPSFLNSPAFTGIPTAPTAAVNTNTTQIATTAFVLGQASGNNPLMNGTVSIGVSLRYSRDDHVHPSDTSRAPINNPVFTGDPQAPTPLTADNDTSIATTAFVKAQGYLDPATAAATYAPINNPVLTGDPQAPTPLTADNDTSIATTAFVKAQGYTDIATVAATYAPINNPVLTGDPQAPTPSTGDNDTSIATTAFVKAQAYAPLASPVFTGDPTGPTPAPGDNDTSLATTAFIQAALASAIPPGVIWEYGAASAPTGWLLCDGSAVSRATYSALFGIISTTFGVGDGSTTFNLPDHRGRVGIGSGTGDAADATAHALGSKGGTETHTLTLAQMAAHDHGGVSGGPSTNTTTGPSPNISDSTTPGLTGANTVQLPNAGTAGTVVNPGSLLIGSQWGTSISAGVTGYSQTLLSTTSHQHTSAAHTHDLANHTHTMSSHTHTISSAGSGNAHPNQQPFLTVNYIIKT
jgi:microcystin-dependent protein